MSYTKLDLKDGYTLAAKDVNYIQDGIVNIDKSLEEVASKEALPISKEELDEILTI